MLRRNTHTSRLSPEHSRFWGSRNSANCFGSSHIFDFKLLGHGSVHVSWATDTRHYTFNQVFHLLLLWSWHSVPGAAGTQHTSLIHTLGLRLGTRELSLLLSSCFWGSRNNQHFSLMLTLGSRLGTRELDFHLSSCFWGSRNVQHSSLIHTLGSRLGTRELNLLLSSRF
ncbi:uncharacterized protein BDZ83DRAFT_658240 [Colletotrichum acutatum]|uniref:Uncharacterized protein n=1 Tax=Glomerella acutata TaxID=27357 RepID=A0AAD8X829_GLOAC|nr:uncharacterized protein BDZ83DRAFT_658240 [Colletotrichum acutatum]KAK1704657.1 hypothetical protein BDZ83DRAFT_658240 [Colletotrichum acutatum]